MKRVVVIDDDQPSRRHLMAIVNSGGYEIAGEAGARQNRRWRLAHDISDVMLMAVGLADVDGIENSHGGDN
ncbi:MAG TPA: hypothetical protein VJQ55_03775 [Candidatus Binatia bacterium]|nr:hypothetical protein [Candidatus Binatia bacterium]